MLGCLIQVGREGKGGAPILTLPIAPRAGQQGGEGVVMQGGGQAFESACTFEFESACTFEFESAGTFGLESAGTFEL